MGDKFEGIIPPVTTPFSEDGEVLYGALARNMERYLKTRLSGFLLLGSNGESVHLNEAERLEVVRQVDSTLPADRRLVVGVSCASLAEASAFVDRLSGFRVDALLVGAPSYYKNRMNLPALVGYFRAVADRSPFPVLLYNVPQYSGLELAPAVVRELAGHPNVVGMKDSSGNISYVQHILESTRGQEFELIMGSAQALGPALCLGVRAAILAVACAAPELPIELLEAHHAGRPIGDLARRLFQVANAVTSLYGVPGLKYAMDKVGYEGGCCRAPLLPLTPAEREDIERRLAFLTEPEVARRS